MSQPVSDKLKTLLEQANQAYEKSLKPHMKKHFAVPNQSVPSTPQTFIQEVTQAYYEKSLKPHNTMFGYAIVAGLFIALAFVFYITTTTASGDMPWGMSRLVGGLVFSTGLMFVLVCGAELFTSSVLSINSRVEGRITTKQLVNYTGRVYLGNLVGALLLVLLVVAGKMYMLNGGAWGANVIYVASAKLQHSWTQAFALGILCNLLVCISVLMSFTVQDKLSKCLIILFPIALFVSAGFEHCIANMFIIPLGVIFAQTDILSALDVSYIKPAYVESLTFGNFLFSNLIPVTLGNIVGGFVVGLSYWYLDNASKKPAKKDTATEQVHAEQAQATQVETAQAVAQETAPAEVVASVDTKEEAVAQVETVQVETAQADKKEEQADKEEIQVAAVQTDKLATEK